MASPASADARVQSSAALEDSVVSSTQSTAFDDQQSSGSFDRNDHSSSSVSAKSITSRSALSPREEGQKDISFETTGETANMSAACNYEEISHSPKSNLPPWLRTQSVIASIASIEPAVVNVPDQSILNELHSSSGISSAAMTPTLIPHQRARHEHMFASPHPQAEDSSNISVALARRTSLNPVVAAAAQRLPDPPVHLFLPMTTQGQHSETISEPLVPVSQSTPLFTQVDPSPDVGSAAQTALRTTFPLGGGVLSGTFSPATFQHFGSQGLCSCILFHD